VESTVALNPIYITPVLNGSQLELNWPEAHMGWRLLSQTNDLATGLSPTWFEVPGSQDTNQMFFPILPQNPSVFYQLVFP